MSKKLPSINNGPAYQSVVTGKLKLKEQTWPSSITKKKKKREHDKAQELVSKIVEQEEISSSEKIEVSTENPPTQPGVMVYKTDAEKRFEAIKRQRDLDKASKLATKSHRQRVEEFNKYLNNLSEHYDIPKVGPG